jgi:hypothetical protein
MLALRLICSLAILGLFSPAASADPTTELLKKADSIAQEVSRLRGLKLKRKIRRGVMTKSQIRKRVRKLVDMEYTPAELAGEALSYKRLGLIPANANYLQTMLKLLEDQIAGFYDPHVGQLYIASWNQVGGDEVMAHEIDHALQDQHFDLKTFMKSSRKNGDAAAARQALVEGDGLALMLEYAMATKFKQPPPWANPVLVTTMTKTISMQTGQMKNVPLALRESLIFPYVGGLEFVAHFRKHQPWSAIDKIYRKPPLSTEQILHPDKYDSYERPHEVKEGAIASLAGTKSLSSTVFGEKAIELWLRQHEVDDQRAVTAAAGWGGDRYAVFGPAKGASVDNSVGVMMTSWDDEADAIEFFQALERALPKMEGDQGRMQAGSLTVRVSKSRLTLAERKGDRVLVIVAAPKATAAKIAAEAWASWTVTRP